MLELVDIRKVYRTGDLVQEALAGVTLNFRDSEFVAVLGPSGSGKTTLLNIIGGLDRYDSGDLIINGVSTKNYSDRDWDSYRNHKIGFVFQNYNLIPHQSVLSNVELALTIAGVSREERRTRAKKALEDVGLGDQVHKRPSELSGGQMQRVAIARALVNDPEILLADEPTGALDSETSKQVMELLKEVAKDRLVVMVTHNPDLADTYATRIVKLYDGVIIDDTDPFFIGGESIAEESLIGDEIAKGEVAEEAIAPVRKENMGKASMSFWTSVSLSFNNMRTKLGRTILTAFAGSIGIIGIALIMSMSGGINDYIEDIQMETMTTYPISVESEAIDLEGLMSSASSMTETFREGRSRDSEDGVTTSSATLRMTSALSSSIALNNLSEFKQYLDDPDSPIHQYIGESGIIYTYDTQFNVYAIDPDGEIINTDSSYFDSDGSSSGSSFSLSSLFGGSSNSSGSDNFEQLMPGPDDTLVSPTVTDNYDLVYGSWPTSYDEVVLVLNSNGQVSVTTMYELGLLPASEYRDILARLDAGEEVDLPAQNISYEDICAHTFYLIPAASMYVETEGGIFRSIGTTGEELEALLGDAIELNIVGIIQPDENATLTNVTATIGYTGALTDYIIEYTNNSPVVQAQIANPDVNVLTGVEFASAEDTEMFSNTEEWLTSMDDAEKASLMRTLIDTFAGNYSFVVDLFLGDTDEELAAMFDEYIDSASGMTYEVLEALFNVYAEGGSYDENMSAFGYVNLDAPISIDIYVDTFEDRDGVMACIDEYNTTVPEDYQIVYTDYLGLLLSSITTIIDMVSYVLIAFVAVSLIVSSIMIGIITYISVLERTKEIGILRALGASKSNIAQVFDAESLIIGLAAGLFGVIITLILLIPINALIQGLAGTDIVTAVLEPSTAVILVLLSMLLTFIAGLIPSSNASRRDPVVALRTE